MHVPGQLINPSLDVTVPLPVPPGVTVSVNCCVATVKVAVTVVAALIVTGHVGLVPAQLPPQPPNVDPLPAAAVSVTFAPLL